MFQSLHFFMNGDYKTILFKGKFQNECKHLKHLLFPLLHSLSYKDAYWFYERKSTIIFECVIIFLDILGISFESRRKSIFSPIEVLFISVLWQQLWSNGRRSWRASVTISVARFSKTIENKNIHKSLRFRVSYI